MHYVFILFLGNHTTLYNFYCPIPAIWVKVVLFEAGRFMPRVALMGRDNWRVMKCGSTYLSMSVIKQVVYYLSIYFIKSCAYDAYVYLKSQVEIYLYISQFTMDTFALLKSSIRFRLHAPLCLLPHRMFLCDFL